MPRYNNETKAQAVARIQAGDATASKIAEELGASHNTVNDWVRKAAKLPETDSEKKQAETIDGIRARIEEQQERLRDQLLGRMADLIPGEEDLRAVATAYGIVTDKQLLAQGGLLS